MDLLTQIREAGIVGCGGAGFPTHVKLNCKVEYLIINAAECEPLLRTDHWLMEHKSSEIITAVELMADMVSAQKVFIALKETYHDEINALSKTIQEKNSRVKLFFLKNFYPAGDEQIMVCEVTGRTVPPSGIPLDVGAVISNLATTYQIYEASLGLPFTHKYLTVTGAVAHPMVLKVPIGMKLTDCIQAAGGTSLTDYHVLVGGPMMGKLLDRHTLENSYVTKTTSGLIVVADSTPLVQKKTIPMEISLKRARTSCIQCSYCTQMCPRYLTGHPIQPHRIMRKLAYAVDLPSILEDTDVQQSMTCSECGVCETYACPMGLQPRQVNIYIKNQLRAQNFRYPKPTEPLHCREERDYRRTPSKRLAIRLGVDQYYDYVIKECTELETNCVHIPLRQHIGAPLTPVVKAGDVVTCGDLIASITENTLGASLHASLSGTVTEVTDTMIVIKANE